jgi:hypothetical protein
MKILPMIPVVIGWLISGCSQPLEDRPPLVGPDVRTWRLELPAQSERQSQIDIHEDGKDKTVVGFLHAASKRRDSFVGRWGRTHSPDFPVSIAWYWTLDLSADGQAEFRAFNGTRWPADAPDHVRAMSLIAHLVGHWKPTGDRTGIVYLRPAPDHPDGSVPPACHHPEVPFDVPGGSEGPNT